MAYDDYCLISIEVDGRILTATVNAPPINVITLALYGELLKLSEALAADPDVLVFVLKSADPDFFLAHFDVGAILDFPTEPKPTRKAAANNAYHAMCERFRTMDKVTIAQIEGRLGGGGSELCMSFDMRFGVVGKTVINQMEVPLGILPGGGGTQTLPRLIGRNRALEVILGAMDLDALTAERWGYLNRALPGDEIGPFVSALAKRIAAFPIEAVRLAKQAINGADGPLDEGLVEESYLFQQLTRTPDARRNMQRFLEMGGQTREVELNVAELSGRLEAG